MSNGLSKLGLAVEQVELEDGSTGIAISRVDPRAGKMKRWIEEGKRADVGSVEDRAARRERIFEQLRNIDALTVIELSKEYFSTFPKHPGATDLTVDARGVGISFLENHESYFFDPDRLVAMCRALQDAVRKVAATTEGPVNVLEAGFGLGYVAMSALALNEELDNRVRIFGLELNLATLHRAGQVLDYFGVPSDWCSLRPFDATIVKGIPEGVHILVAEHFAGGVLCAEPLAAVHRNLIPQLTEPFFVIPEGLEVHGRVVDAENYLSADGVRDVVTKKLGRALSKARPVEQSEIERLDGTSKRVIVKSQMLARFKFADVLEEGGYDGALDLRLSGPALRDGVGLMELRGVPTFHNDDGVGILENYRLYGYGAKYGRPGKAYFGTSINWWGHVRDMDYLMAFMQAPSQSGDNISDSMAIATDLAFSSKFKFEKGGNYEVSLVGEMDNLAGRVKVALDGQEVDPEFSLMPGEAGLIAGPKTDFDSFLEALPEVRPVKDPTKAMKKKRNKKNKAARKARKRNRR